MMQIDHMSVSVNQVTVKRFQAWNPKSKYIQAYVYSNATSSTAKRFLLELIQSAPFKISSIQVDGGSEFMRHFEEACADLEIELFVLPPKRLHIMEVLKRETEPSEKSFMPEGIMMADSARAINFELQKTIHKYNSYRPHANLNMLTPLSYILSG